MYALLGIVVCFFLLSEIVYAAWYEKDIVYQGAITKLLKRGDINWSGEDDSDYNFRDVVVNARGTKVLFTVSCRWCDTAETRVFLMNTDGSGLEELSGMIPQDMRSPYDGWSNLRINDDGSKIFFKTYIETGYYDDVRIFVYDVESESLSLAVNQNDFNSLDCFGINEDGSHVFVKGFDNDDDGTVIKGLFYAQTLATRTWYFDICSLPNVLECSHSWFSNSFLKSMGVSPQNNFVFFRWDSDYYNSDGSSVHDGLWCAGLDGSASLLSEAHYSINEFDWRGVCDTEGTKVAYEYLHDYDVDNTRELAVIDVATGDQTVVGWTSQASFDYHMTRSGGYILANGTYGDEGQYYQTMIDLESGTSRDTWSDYISNLSNAMGYTSNITEDDRYYFYSRDDASSSFDENAAGVYRIDMQSQGDPAAPHVLQIAFDKPALLDQEDETISVRAIITDPQGIENVEWVKITTLVDGQEEPSWSSVPRPLALSGSNSDWGTLYDDGTHGDQVSGDGIFSLEGIETKKSYRDLDSSWYQHKTLPEYIGIRVIVKDTDNNYTIADTRLLITDIYGEKENLTLGLGGSTSVQIGGEGPFTLTSSNPQVVSVTLNENLLEISAAEIGSAVLTIESASGSTTTLSVQVIDTAQTDRSLSPASTGLTGSFESNEPVTITASGAAVTGETLYYKFYYCANYGTSAYETTPWVVMQDYSTSNTCQYTFPEDGTYIVVVRVVTDPDNEPANLPIIGGVVTIGNRENPQIWQISSNISGAVQPGTPVTYTVTASGSAQNTIYYKWYYRAGYGTDDYENMPWVEVQDYSSSTSCEFSFPEQGDYIVVVRAVTDPDNEPVALPIIGTTAACRE